jgi:hypothetical protein
MAYDMVAGMSGDNAMAVDKDDDMAIDRDNDVVADISIQVHLTSIPLKYDPFF